MNTDNTQAKSTPTASEQAAEVAEARERNQKLAAELMAADAELTAAKGHMRRLVETCETADPDELAVRAHDLHRINFLIHHAESITVAGCGTIAGDDLLMLRATLDTWRGARRESKPLRAPARS